MMEEGRDDLVHMFPVLYCMFLFLGILFRILIVWLDIVKVEHKKSN